MMFIILLSLCVPWITFAAQECSLFWLPQDVIVHIANDNFAHWSSLRSTCTTFQQWLPRNELPNHIICTIPEETFKKALLYYAKSISSKLKDQCPSFLKFKMFVNHNNDSKYIKVLAEQVGWDRSQIRITHYTDICFNPRNIECPLSTALFISATTDINIQDAQGNTALIWTVRRGYTGIVMMLLNNGADVNMQDHAGNTALIWATYDGRKEIVELLLNKNANVNIQAKNGNTALILATRYGHKKIVKMLRQKKPKLISFDFF